MSKHLRGGECPWARALSLAIYAQAKKQATSRPSLKQGQLFIYFIYVGSIILYILFMFRYLSARETI